MYRREASWSHENEMSKGSTSKNRSVPRESGAADWSEKWTALSLFRPPGLHLSRRTLELEVVYGRAVDRSDSKKVTLFAHLIGDSKALH